MTKLSRDMTGRCSVVNFRAKLQPIKDADGSLYNYVISVTTGIAFSHLRRTSRGRKIERANKHSEIDVY